MYILICDYVAETTYRMYNLRTTDHEIYLDE